MVETELYTQGRTLTKRPRLFTTYVALSSYEENHPNLLSSKLCSYSLILLSHANSPHNNIGNALLSGIVVINFRIMYQFIGGWGEGTGLGLILFVSNPVCVLRLDTRRCVVTPGSCMHHHDIFLCIIILLNARIHE